MKQQETFKFKGGSQTEGINPSLSSVTSPHTHTHKYSRYHEKLPPPLSAEGSQSVRHERQLVLMSPVAKERSTDRPIRAESSESVADWENRTGAIEFLPILNTET